VNEFEQLEGGRKTACDPCRLVRRVNEFEQLEGGRQTACDPCRLVRRVKKFMPPSTTASQQTYSPASKLAGVWESAGVPS